MYKGLALNECLVTAKVGAIAALTPPYSPYGIRWASGEADAPPIYRWGSSEEEGPVEAKKIR